MKNTVFVEDFDSNIAEKFLIKITKCAKTATKILKQKSRILSVNFVFLTEDEMKKLNKQTRKKDAITDVISLPLLDLKPHEKIRRKNFANDYDAVAKTILLGDVFICYAKALQQADEYGHSIEREVCYLATHGTLHLLGFDHESKSDRQIMRGIEEIVLRKNGLSL